MPGLQTFHPLWNGKNYHRNSHVQSSAGHELLDHLRLTGSEKIVDVGCGDGKISASLSIKAREGSVLAVDLSESMICFAKQQFPKCDYPNLNFIQGDAAELVLVAVYDIIFSCFAIQWLKDPTPFFTKAFESLAKGGQLVLSIPLDISKALEEATAKTCNECRWHRYFQNFSPGWHFQSPLFYETQVQNKGFTIEYLKVVEQTIFFKDLADLKNYIIQWFSYVNAVEQPLQESFFDTVMKNYTELTPCKINGELPFTFSRIDIIARK